MTIDPTVVIAVIGALAAGLSGAARIIYTDMRKDRDYWRDVAIGSLRNADTAIDLAAKRTNGA